MDCICCGFGAILLLFILTAKRQSNLNSVEVQQRIEAVQSLRSAIANAERKERDLRKKLAASAPEDATGLAQLESLESGLKNTLEELEKDLSALQTATASSEHPAAEERPSADRQYLSGLRLAGPRVLILLESSGSMVSETTGEAIDFLSSGKAKDALKWKRAKAAVRSVLAALPKGTQAAVFAYAESPEALSGTEGNPWFDPYDNTALISFLGRLDVLEAGGGADLARALHHVGSLELTPSSILSIGDGLPTAPSRGRSLSESDRIGLLKQAMAVQQNVPFNVLLFPFEGDPAAAGLFWQMSGRTLGVTIVPDSTWPPMN